MMGDREARILGAGDAITVGEKKYELTPVVAKHLCNLEREALKFYKRQYLTTYSENIDLLGEDKGMELLQDEMRKTASWSLADLPQRDVFSTTDVPVTDELKKWVQTKQPDADTSDETVVKALLSTMLDQKAIRPRDVKKMTGKYPLQGKVRYDQWWITACTEGMIVFIANSVRFNGKPVSEEEIQQWSFPKIVEAARKVEDITSADMGNM